MSRGWWVHFRTQQQNPFLYPCCLLPSITVQSQELIFPEYQPAVICQPQWWPLHPKSWWYCGWECVLEGQPTRKFCFRIRRPVWKTCSAIQAKCPDASQGLPKPQLPHHKRKGWREVLSKIYNLHRYVFMRLSENQLLIYYISLTFLGSCSSHWMLWGHLLNGIFKVWTIKCLYPGRTEA